MERGYTNFLLSFVTFCILLFLVISESAGTDIGYSIISEYNTSIKVDIFVNVSDPTGIGAFKILLKYNNLNISDVSSQEFMIVYYLDTINSSLIIGGIQPNIPGPKGNVTLFTITGSKIVVSKDIDIQILEFMASNTQGDMIENTYNTVGNTVLTEPSIENSNPHDEIYDKHERDARNQTTFSENAVDSVDYKIKLNETDLLDRSSAIQNVILNSSFVNVSDAAESGKFININKGDVENIKQSNYMGIKENEVNRTYNNSLESLPSNIHQIPFNSGVLVALPFIISLVVISFKKRTKKS